MARFDRQVETALRLIAKNGQVVKWRQVRDIPIDPEKPWEAGTPDDTELDATICFLPVDKVNRETLMYLAKTDIAAGQVVGLMGQVTFDPTLKDVVIRDGEELRIFNIDLLSPNGQKILYTIVFEK